MKNQVERGEKVETVFVTGDRQIPFHDTRALRLIRKVAEDLQPDIEVALGDELDLPDLSLKFLTKPDHRNQLSTAFRMYRDDFEAFSEVCPNTKRIWIEGNHEKRLRVFVEQTALAEFAKPGGVLTIPNLVGIAEKVEYVFPYGNVWKYKYGPSNSHSFIFKHGEVTTPYASMRELEKAHRSGISGHTHRMSFSANTTYDGPHGWWSNGALCNIRGDNCPPGYTETDQYRNWQQGFSVVTFSKERSIFQVEQTIIHEGKCMFRGKLYEDNGSLDKKRTTFV